MERAVMERMTELQKKTWDEFNIRPSIALKTGHVFSEIIDFANKKKADLIVMGIHGASGYIELFAGSNTHRVVTLSDMPVLTVNKEKGKAGFRKILIPIDDSLHSREKVNIAVTIAKLFGSSIHILGLARSSGKEGLIDIKLRTGSVEKIIRLANLPFKTTFVKGINLSMAAMEYAEKNKCDLIVINTGHESKTNGIFLGAFAKQIVNQSKVPVLSFKHSQGHYDINTEGFGIG